MNKVGLALIILFMSALTACLPDRASWSPDGKQFYYICEKDGSVVARDSATAEIKTVFNEAGWRAVLCYALSPTGTLLIAANRPGTDPNEPIRDLHLVLANGKVLKEIALNVSAEAGFAASADGRRAFFSRHDKAAARWEFWMMELSDEGVKSSKLLLSQLTGMGYPCASKDGKKVVLTFETSIGVLDVEAGRVETIVPAPKVTPSLYGVWVQNEKAIAYIESFAKRSDPNSGNDLGILKVVALADKKTKRLGGGIPILRRPMVGADGKTVYVTQALTQHESGNAEMGEIAMKNIQIAAFDTESGERKIITSEPDGGFWPAPSPVDGGFAYYTGKPGTRGDWPDNLILKVQMESGGSAITIQCL